MPTTNVAPINAFPTTSDTSFPSCVPRTDMGYASRQTTSPTVNPAALATSESALAARRHPRKSWTLRSRSRPRRPHPDDGGCSPPSRSMVDRTAAAMRVPAPFRLELGHARAHKRGRDARAASAGPRPHHDDPVAGFQPISSPGLGPGPGGAARRRTPFDRQELRSRQRQR